MFAAISAWSASMTMHWRGVGGGEPAMVDASRYILLSRLLVETVYLEGAVPLMKWKSVIFKKGSAISLRHGGASSSMRRIMQNFLRG